VAFSADGRTLAAGSDDGAVLLWDVANPADPRRVGGLLAGHGGLVSSVAFSADGRTLAAGSDDGTVLLWEVGDPADPRRLGGPLAGHSGPVSSVAFSGDGRTLATGSADNTVILWNVSGLVQLRAVAVDVACQRAGRGLTSTEWAAIIPDRPDRHYLPTCDGLRTEGG
jgi:WD40 repeat protein